MPTLTTATIAESGGDYTSVANWEASEQRHLVFFDEQHTATITGTWTNPDNTKVVILGWTMDATRYALLEAVGDARATMPWSETAYRHQLATGQDLVWGWQIEENYFRIDGLQIELVYSNNNGNRRAYAVYVNSDYNRITNCHIRVVYSLSLNQTDGTGRRVALEDEDGEGGEYWNNFLVITRDNTGLPSRTYAYRQNDTFTNKYFYNNTIVIETDASGLGGGNYGLTLLSTCGTVTNNLLVTNGHVGATGSFLPTTTGSSGYNASDDETAFGSNSRINQTFTFIDSSSSDWHLASTDVGARGFGTDLSGTFTDDFDGETRTVPWDIGADQFVPPPPPPFGGYKLKAPKGKFPRFRYI